MTKPIAPDLYDEKHCAEAFGVSRPKMRLLRKEHLVPDADWRMRENTVCLTDAGLKKIEGVLGGKLVNDPATANGGAAARPLAPPLRCNLMVTAKPRHRKTQPQRHVLVCRECRPDQVQITSWQLPGFAAQLGVERTVRVRDNENFLPGMVLEAVSSGPGCWQYAGRLPRRPGRW